MIHRTQGKGSVSFSIVDLNTARTVRSKKNRNQAMRRPAMGKVSASDMAGSAMSKSGQVFGGSGGSNVRIERR